MTMFETADMSEMEIRDAFGFTKTKPIVFKAVSYTHLRAHET